MMVSTTFWIPPTARGILLRQARAAGGAPAATGRRKLNRMALPKTTVQALPATVQSVPRMSHDVLKDIEQLEDSLWAAADTLRANSKLTSSEYCMPVLGVIFLRHATNRYDAASLQIVEDQSAGRMPKRPLVKQDFIKRRALMLPKEARYDELLKLPKGTNLGAALVEAMNAIERDFEPLLNQLPKDYDK